MAGTEFPFYMLTINVCLTLHDCRQRPAGLMAGALEYADDTVSSLYEVGFLWFCKCDIDIPPFILPCSWKEKWWIFPC